MEHFSFDALSDEQKMMYNKFMTKIIKKGRVNTNMSPCWTHTMSASSSGYGQIMFSYKSWNLHRLSYWIHNGCPDLITSDVIEHSCDNKECSNPEHLTLGNHKSNCSAESLARVRPKKEKKEVKEGNWSHINQLGDQSGENNQTAILTWEKVREIRKKKEAGLKYGELKKMAEHYGIAYITIQKIVAGSLWKE